MHAVKNEVEIGRSLEGWALFKMCFSNWLVRLRRKLPYIMWYGQEVDVGVTLRGIASIEEVTLEVEGIVQRYPGRKQTDASKIFEVQKLLRELGITFDSGSGMHGRDWEWDWSLKGPISVRFRGKTKNPEIRTAAPSKAKLKRVK